MRKLIQWYREMKKLEENGEIDELFIYDESCNKFSELTRSSYMDILEFLDKNYGDSSCITHHR